MRRLLVLALAGLSLAGLAGCSNSCQDLGDRICACSTSGVSPDTCKQQVKNLLDSIGVHSGDKATCSAALSTCELPAGLAHDPAQAGDATFCEWVATPCGKVSCGLAQGDIATVCAQTGP